MIKLVKVSANFLPKDNYWFMYNREDGAIFSLSQYTKMDSYCHLFGNGVVMRLGKVIGDRSDITFGEDRTYDEWHEQINQINHNIDKENW